MNLLRSLKPATLYQWLKRLQQPSKRAQLLQQRNLELEHQMQQRTEQLHKALIEVKRQAKQAELINQIVQAIRGTLVLDEILQTTVNQLHEVLNVSRCLIFRPDATEQFAIRYVSEATSEGTSLMGLCCEFYRYYRADLVQGNALFFSRIDHCVAPEVREAARECHIRAIVIVPLIYQNDYIGGISLHQCDREREWTTDEIAFIKAIADRCAIAIHQAELYQQLQIELQERQKAEATLQKLNDALELKVQERTQMLQCVVQQLSQENAERQRTEKALQHSQVQLQAILDNSPAFIYVYDLQNRYILVNYQFEKLLKRPKKELIGRHLNECWPPEIADLFADNNRQVLETGSAIQAEEVAPHADGLHTYVTVKFPLKDEQGNIYAVCGISTDITDRKRIEAALQESEAKFHNLVANVPGMIYQFVMHPDGSQGLSYASPSCRQMWELEPEQMCGDIQTSLEMIYPDDRVILEQSTAISAQTLQPWQWEGRIQTPSGRLKWLQGIARPQKQANGDIVWDGLFIETSDRKHAEVALLNTEFRLGIALKAAQMGTWDWNFKSDRVICSEQTDLIFGFASGGSARTSQDYRDRIHPEDQPLFDRAIDNSREQGIPIDIEYRVVLPDGSIRWVAGKGDTLHISTGELVAMSGVVMDITERKRSETALRDSEFKLRTIVENSNDAIFLKDYQGRYLFINSMGAQLLGRSVAEVLGKKDEDFFSFESAQYIWQLDRAVMEGGKPWTGEEQGEANGNRYTFLSTKAPYVSAQGELLGLIGVCRDITQQKQAEETLKRQFAAVEAAGDGIAIVSLAGDYIYLNQSHAKIFGYERTEELIGQSWTILYCSDEIERICQEALPIVFQTGKWQGEAVAKRRDGTMFSEELSLTLVENNALVCVCRDITERKQTEERLVLRDRAIAASNNGIIISDATHPNNPVIYVNKAFENMTGYTQADVLGKNCRFLQGKDKKQPSLEILRNAIRQGTACTVTLRNYRKDGSYFWNELSLSPIYDSLGKLTHFIGIQSDITERKQAEEDLQFTTSRLSTLIENLQLGVLVKDEGKRVVMINQKFCDIFNIPIAPGALIGADFSDLAETYQHLFARPEEFIRSHNRANQNRKIISNEEIEMRDGRILERDYVPIYVLGEYSGNLWMYRDITQRKQVENEIKSSLQEKEVLLKEIHHRVKNNLQVISSLLRLQSEYIKDEETLAIFTESYNRVQSMALIHEKLYQSSGLSKIDAAEYIQDLTKNLFRSYDISMGCIQLKLNVQSIQLDVDTAIPCGLIINELISNSIKYGFVGRTQGEIYIDLLQGVDSQVTLRIGDNGIGLPPDFDIEEVESLGLQLVAGLTEQIHGKIEIESTQEGTSFFIRFINKVEQLCALGY
ncbi:PAS domain S-box protein [Desertifilum sp. FACHB-1129]|uniref:PAS domain S-box protein n=1 Tax=unclassified Desertifilum TaxID=2621682 RepID=UPI0016826857|nr:MULTISPECIES: PAS domain S-box protein [unclassified Desertifilum]MBD2313598.1 PAS domain S-box protein [Desertifilum sp. FACHB-1129]MBD2320581.1 PAS domain S-box protein [Desertifilum sp. FACHB-866]MBD2330709.1 PAS domain S-box protein [Desertifilum sp. FACHB-868]MDA0210176.1 PAS domain S-box protein [Cyanobacteria bacterium FC1]